VVAQTCITVVLESEGVRCCVAMAVVSATVMARSRSRRCSRNLDSRMVASASQGSFVGSCLPEFQICDEEWRCCCCMRCCRSVEVFAFWWGQRENGATEVLLPASIVKLCCGGRVQPAGAVMTVEGRLTVVMVAAARCKATIGWRCLGFEGRRWWWRGTTSLAEFWVARSWHMSSCGWRDLKVMDCHMAWSEWVEFKC